MIRSRKVTKIKQNRACYIWFIVTFSSRIQKSKPFCNLTPCKTTTEKGQVNLGSHKVKFLNWCFGIKECVILSQFGLRFQKCHSFCAMSRNAQNCTLKNESEFWAICLPKKGYIKRKFGTPDVQAGFATQIPVFQIFKTLDFIKNCIKISSFNLGQRSLVGKSEITVLKNPFLFFQWF